MYGEPGILPKGRTESYHSMTRKPALLYTSYFLSEHANTGQRR